MPYKLRKAPKRELYWVITIETGKKHSKEPIPKEKAKAQMRILKTALKGGSFQFKKEGEQWVIFDDSNGQIITKVNTLKQATELIKKYTKEGLPKFEKVYEPIEYEQEEVDEAANVTTDADEQYRKQLKNILNSLAPGGVINTQYLTNNIGPFLEQDNPAHGFLIRLFPYLMNVNSDTPLHELPEPFYKLMNDVKYYLKTPIHKQKSYIEFMSGAGRRMRGKGDEGEDDEMARLMEPPPIAVRNPFAGLFEPGMLRVRPRRQARKRAISTVHGAILTNAPKRQKTGQGKLRGGIGAILPENMDEALTTEVFTRNCQAAGGKDLRNIYCFELARRINGYEWAIAEKQKQEQIRNEQENAAKLEQENKKREEDEVKIFLENKEKCEKENNYWADTSMTFITGTRKSGTCRPDQNSKGEYKKELCNKQNHYYNTSNYTCDSSRLPNGLTEIENKKRIEEEERKKLDLLELNKTQISEQKSQQEKTWEEAKKNCLPPNFWNETYKTCLDGNVYDSVTGKTKLQLRKEECLAANNKWTWPANTCDNTKDSAGNPKVTGQGKRLRGGITIEQINEIANKYGETIRIYELKQQIDEFNKFLNEDEKYFIGYYFNDKNFLNNLITESENLLKAEITRSTGDYGIYKTKEKLLDVFKKTRDDLGNLAGVMEEYIINSKLIKKPNKEDEKVSFPPQPSRGRGLRGGITPNEFGAIDDFFYKLLKTGMKLSHKKMLLKVIKDYFNLIESNMNYNQHMNPDLEKLITELKKQSTININNLTFENGLFNPETYNKFVELLLSESSKDEKDTDIIEEYMRNAKKQWEKFAKESPSKSNGNPWDEFLKDNPPKPNGNPWDEYLKEKPPKPKGNPWDEFLKENPPVPDKKEGKGKCRKCGLFR